MRRNLKNVARVFARLAVIVLVLATTGGCVGTEKFARLEGEVSGLKTVAGENRRIAQGAMAAANAAQTTADQARQEAEQMGRTATDAQTLAGRLDARLDGFEKIQKDHVPVIAEYREFREKTMGPLMKRVDNHGKIIKALQGDEPMVPNTSALVAGPGAPALKGIPPALAKQEGPITLTNPSAAQIKRALEYDERPRNEVRLYGPTDEARQKVFDWLRATVKQAGFDPNTITPRSLNATSARVEVDFGPIPDTVKAARTAPKP